MAKITQPTHAQVRAAREAAGLTQGEAAALVHGSSRTWQNWESEGPEGRKIPLASWELFLIKTGQ